MKKKVICILLLSVMAFASCSPEKGYSEQERTETSFLHELEGHISPAQWWKTSVQINAVVHTDVPFKMFLMSGPGTGVLYDSKEADSSGSYVLTAPQGKGSTLYLVSIYEDKRRVQEVKLTGKNEETITVNAAEQDLLSKLRMEGGIAQNLSSLSFGAEFDDYHYDPSESPVLHGNSILGGAFHYEFDLPQMLETVQLLSMMKNCIDAKYGHGLNCNYELESKGPFHITWLAGYESDQTEHILGYYVHSPGTYEDFELHDVSETHKYDIIDGFAKVQYQISDETYSKNPDLGILPNRWYDANYDMLDVFGSKRASNPERLGDDAYNSIEVFNTFKTGISRLRGLAFTIDVPAGKRVGFYLKAKGEYSQEQWDMLNRLGIKGIGNKSEWQATNFCVEKFNQNQTHRSCIIPYEHSTWMGMEDVLEGGDFDCNDVMFGITTDMDVYDPEIVEPDIDIIVDVDGTLPWTIAYEDVYRDPDFDFNDAVIKLVPDFENEVCCVTVEAVGSESRMYLHYDGPNGDINLGEMHELLGAHAGMKMNTAYSAPQYPFVEVDCVAWPKDYTMDNDAKRFWIEIQRGTCEDCTDVITLATEPGAMPEALLVAGEWKWPLEGVHIFSAYSGFPDWAKDVNKIGYWYWYSNPKTNAVVAY